MHSTRKAASAVVTTLSAEGFAEFFAAKTEAVRLDATGATSALFAPTVMQLLESFNPVASGKIERVIRQSPNKTNQVGPLPT